MGQISQAQDCDSRQRRAPTTCLAFRYRHLSRPPSRSRDELGLKILTQVAAAQNFLGMVQLACAVILLRHL